MMTNKRFLTLADISKLATNTANQILQCTHCRKVLWPTVYGVPRGGIPSALAVLLALQEKDPQWRLTQNPDEATVFVDDIIDSGATSKRFLEQYPHALGFFGLIDKPELKRCDLNSDAWYVFPWEAKDGTDDEGIQENIKRLLQYIGDDPTREGLLETPARVEKAYKEWFSGYGHEGSEVLKTFEDGAENTDEMIVVGPIQFYSHCEHHMAPFFGTVHVAYIPDGKIVGLSKFARLVEIYARRLQVQERLTTQIAEELQKSLAPKGVGVIIRARHLCMESRGAKSTGSETTTSKLIGAMRTNEARAEFLRLAL